jgi:hypothetical protein
MIRSLHNAAPDLIRGLQVRTEVPDQVRDCGQNYRTVIAIPMEGRA